MKRIEDIEKMDLAQMEAIFEDSSTPVPSGLEESVGRCLVAAAAASDAVKGGAAPRRAFPAFAAALAATAAAACLTLLLMLPSRSPRDTFEDPRLAYEQIERTLDYISSKVDKGMSIASQAAPVLENVGEAIELINK